MTNLTNLTDFDFETFRTGKTYYTADWHLGHDRIRELCRRPFDSVTEMNQVILDRTNEKVTGRDTLVIIGDVVMGKLAENLALLGKLRARRIWMLPGNHDRFSLAYGHHGAVETQRTKRELWRSQYEAAHRRLRAEPDRTPSVWSVRIAEQPVLLSHYPYAGDSQEAERHAALRPRDTGLPLVHGHVHTRWRVRGPMFNVGVDVNGFAPVGEDELVDWLMVWRNRDRSISVR